MNNKDEWTLTDIPLQSNANFQVVVEGINTYSYIVNFQFHIDQNSQICEILVAYYFLQAIDDFSFALSCKINTVDQLPIYVFTTPKPDLTCSNSLSQYRCKQSRECINMQDLCNFRYDCNDQTDEKSCPSTCNFECKLYRYFED